MVVIEPEQELRRLDDEAREPAHPLARALLGLSAGGRFTEPAGRAGTVVQVRHKFVARLHSIMERFEARFPGHDGFRSIKVDASAEGGLDEMIGQLKARSDHVKMAQQEYLTGPWPISMLALRVGADTIDVADGLAAQGVQLKVAAGSEAERVAAVREIRQNERRGCVLDLLAFWTHWHLGILEIVVEICGPIHVTQYAFDSLKARRERLMLSARDGLKTAAYVEGGRFTIHEVSHERVCELLADLDEAIGWVEKNAVVCPIFLDDEIPDALRTQIEQGHSDIFDALLLARERNLLLVTDDLPTRQLGSALGFSRSCWSHAILRFAKSNRVLSSNRYVSSTANLIGAGHNYLTVSGEDLMQALHMDAGNMHVPGQFLRQLGRAIGGKEADPVSHARVVIDFIRLVWWNYKFDDTKKAATSFLLRQMIRARYEDYPLLLRAILRFSTPHVELQDFVTYWLRGHMIPLERVITGRIEASQPSR